MTKWNSIKAIAFDLDGTLIDSVPDLAAATNATLAELGLAEVSQAQVRSWVGNGTQALMERAISYALGREVSKDELKQAMVPFLIHYEYHLEKHSSLYPNVIETLTALTQAGFKLALVTNKPHKFTVPLLRAFGLIEFFDLVLGGDSLAKMKPDPLPLAHVLATWQMQPDELLMIGDSKNDILAARAAKVSSIGLTYGYNYGEHISLSEPNAVCDDLAQISEYLPSACV
ncbi:phosphoglycolate phosphatase [Shewanella denitrificans OS217]|jgi:phosphoglycolate phosphatase|uniref:Phosphoglycolate phosphatase n=1 Tax=Shewanella denitrificans (strain OS217 / ATCC BAA-1090 / DSM 15013) TaxID=318161 RepID=Q12SL2_SHEDO|nr:phosphoglycolate phosphatase [Shewanella denitrificans]ABE53564.1 phosphoglycolate phosphatase [Shewanella denitrificans OS217]